MKRFSSNSLASALVFALCSLLALLSGCMNSENPDLLNAPLAEESIRVRLLNLSGDAGARELQLEGTKRTGDIPFAMLSEPISAPADSAQALIFKGTTEEYKTPYKVVFARNTLFTLIALPNAKGTEPVDTMLVISAGDSASVRNNYNDSYLRFINAYPDSTVSYSLRLGCPNGTALATQLAYRAIGSKTEMGPGTYTVSLLRHTGVQNSEVIGYYSITLGARSDYSVLVCQMQGRPELLLLHDRGIDGAALQQLTTVSASKAEVRVLNFSSQSVGISKTATDQPDEVIAQNIASRTASAFANVSACTSASEDTLKIGGTPHVVGLPIEVLKQYIIATIDSGTSAAANFSMAIPPSTAGTSTDSASIRVANLAWGFPALEISLGAHTAANGNYITGQVLAPSLDFAELGEPIRCLPGPAPIVVFSDGPKQLRATAFTNELRAGGRYLLIIARNGAKLELTLFDESNPVERPLDVLPEGVFTQVVNAVPDADVTFTLGSVVSNRSLFYGAASATVLPAGVHTLSAGNVQQQIPLEIGKRTLIVLSGQSSAIEASVFTTDPMGAQFDDVRRRFVNAAPSLTALTVRLDYDAGYLFAEKLPYRQISPVDRGLQARKITLLFRDVTADGSEKTVLERNNIPFSFGQNFTIVFAGNRSDNYRAIILQEF